MSELKATPGPWRTKHGSLTIFIDASIGGGMAQEVAACGPTENWEQQAYNAHLIAAAPDGYALAEMVMEICGNPKGVSESSQDLLYETALQFMKKARGE